MTDDPSASRQILRLRRFIANFRRQIVQMQSSIDTGRVTGQFAAATQELARLTEIEARKLEQRLDELQQNSSGS